MEEVGRNACAVSRDLMPNGNYAYGAICDKSKAQGMFGTIMPPTAAAYPAIADMGWCQKVTSLRKEKVFRDLNIASGIAKQTRAVTAETRQPST